MSEAKFTRGPWKATNPSCQRMRIVEFESGAFNDNDEYLQIHVTKSNSNHIDVANLIAAAPEMYELIETYMGGHPEAEKLLAKARGENV